jgi:hypothetical protein
MGKQGFITINPIIAKDATHSLKEEKQSLNKSVKRFLVSSTIFN